MYEQNVNSPGNSPTCETDQGRLNSQIHRGQSPFKPEYDQYITDYPGRGKLKIQISEANEAIPVEDVKINVSFVYDGVRYSLYDDITDSSGIVDNMVLPARAVDLALEPKRSDVNEANYLVSLSHPMFDEIIDEGVTIYDRIETILPITMTPCGHNNNHNNNNERTEGK